MIITRKQRIPTAKFILRFVSLRVRLICSFTQFKYRWISTVKREIILNIRDILTSNFRDSSALIEAYNNKLWCTTTSSSLPGGESKHVFLFLFEAQGKVQIDLLFSANKTVGGKISKFVARAILHVCPIRNRFRARVFSHSFGFKWQTVDS